MCRVVIRTVTALLDAIAASHTEPLMLFKHSETCPTSSYALKELQAYVRDTSVPGNYSVMSVLTDRHICQEVAIRCEVTHESPQLLVIHGGRVECVLCHAAITRHAIARALARVRDRASS